MVVKRTCTFCAGEIEPGTGTMFVKRDGAVLFFCSTVCRRDTLKLGRVGARLKWTRAYASRMSQEKARSREEKSKVVRVAPAASKTSGSDVSASEKQEPAVVKLSGPKGKPRVAGKETKEPAKAKTPAEEA